MKRMRDILEKKRGVVRIVLSCLVFKWSPLESESSDLEGVEKDSLSHGG